MNDVSNAEFWQPLYDSHTFPWDLGRPTPIFQRLVETNAFPPGKMLVLGAGHGYDARLFARHGFEITAVDFALGAVEIMKKLAEPNTPVTILQSDFFELPQALNGTFDYVLDTTSFCAIDPKRRGEYAKLVRRVLEVNGRYIILAFPIGKRPGGPPFVVQPDNIIELFTEQLFSLESREFPPDSIPSRTGVEELLILKKGAD